MTLGTDQLDRAARMYYVVNREGLPLPYLVAWALAETDTGILMFLQDRIRQLSYDA